MVEHVFKVTLYKKLLGMISRYALNQIVVEYERVSYAGIDSSRCGCVMRTIHGLPCACKLARYVVGNNNYREDITFKKKTLKPF